MNFLSTAFVNWKTTLLGLLAAVGLYLTNQDASGWHFAGVVLGMVGTLIGGAAARDADKTSEASGAK